MERDLGGGGRRFRRGISIHALRMERDAKHSIITLSAADFNPRAPHGARQSYIKIPYFIKEFQSTRSAWSATVVFFCILF